MLWCLTIHSLLLPLIEWYGGLQFQKVRGFTFNAPKDICFKYIKQVCQANEV